MAMNNLRKTHPMVLFAAAALTVFSLLGSAMISGLIPSAHSARESELSERVPMGIPSETTGLDSKPAKQAANSATCSICGTVISIRTVEQEGEGSGLGAVAGGVAGGVIGNQIGKGNGNTLMTVLGVGGGAYAGHTIEKKIKTTTAYIVKVKMENGSYRTITQYSPPQHSVGDQVKVTSGQLVSA